MSAALALAGIASQRGGARGMWDQPIDFFDQILGCGKVWLQPLKVPV
jgi:hypothetical protein